MRTIGWFWCFIGINWKSVQEAMVRTIGLIKFRGKYIVSLHLNFYRTTALKTRLQHDL